MSSQGKLIKLALPKGSLEKATFSFFERSGYKIRGQDRTYRPIINDEDIEIKILRPQEIPRFVEEGVQDLGITGSDWIRETKAGVSEVLDLEYGQVRLVMAVPKQISKLSLAEICENHWREGKKFRLATEYLNIASEYLTSLPFYRDYFGSKAPKQITPWWTKGENDLASIYLSFGATEAKPPEDADAIMDVVETGTTLEQNGLVPIETLLKSTARLIASPSALKDGEKREKVLDIMSMLKGTVEGSKKLHIFVNVRKENLQKLIDALPALKKPTVSELSDKDWYSVNTIIDRDYLIKAIPKLRKLSQGLVVHEPRQILPLEEIETFDLNGKNKSAKGLP
ncbi:MAG TPA: ATP phosphoribosyltransferase [Nitrososphaerales archaeon]|nr:ATP phosphoribosyltransferase [Nitrososphaerales archaeon]